MTALGRVSCCESEHSLIDCTDLQWVWDLGTAELRVTFRPGYSRLICVSTIQMLILLAFKSADGGVMTADQISEATG